MKRKIAFGIIIISVVIVAVSVIVGFYLTNQNSTPQPIQSVSNYYLPNTRIFVVSANAGYGSYPFPTVTRPPFGPGAGSPIAQSGEPCVIINVNLRNDYSTQYPAPNPLPNNSTEVFVGLTANVFNGENQINSTDITNTNWIASAGTNEAFTSLHYGEITTITIYLATNNRNVTGFQLQSRYIGEVIPP